MRLGISGQALGDVKSFREIVKTGKKYGVSDYEIWPGNVGAIHDYSTGDIDGLKRTMEEEQIRVYCVTLGSGFSPEATADPDIYANYLIRAIDAAKEIGAAVVNHYCGCICPKGEPDFEVMEKYWRTPLEYAEKAGIVLALENEAHDATSTPAKMLRIMEHFNHPNFKTNFDAVNYFHASCEGFPYAYALLKDHIGYVHIKNACLPNSDVPQPEYNRGAPMSGIYAPAPIQYTPIPQGAVNVAGLLSRLEQDGIYKGICTLEPHTTVEHVEEFYAEESAWLKKLGFFSQS